jgi:hypothetical protein
MQGGESVQGAMWCITRRHANEGGAREPAEPTSSSRRGRGGVSEPEHIASSCWIATRRPACGSTKLLVVTVLDAVSLSLGVADDFGC